MNGRYYVGEWLVEPEQSRLVRGSETAKLDPKAIQVLSSRGSSNEVLTKEQIISSVWDGAFVSDEVLTTAIWGLRKAFGDDAKEPRYIQTIPRKGYRLIAPVEGGDRGERGSMGAVAVSRSFGVLSEGRAVFLRA
jgi:DNA-binding winged helix-turn-helix (wHTH) protein